MARNPERIPAFLRELGLLWTAHSDQRFGQLVMNLCRVEGGFADPWEWEEDKWLDKIRSYDAHHGLGGLAVLGEDENGKTPH